MKKLRQLILVSVALSTVAVFSVATAGARVADVTGAWKITVETPNGTGNPTATFKQQGEELTGNYKGRFGEGPLKGTVKGNEINFTVKLSAQGQDFEIEYSGTIDGDTMKGKVKLGQAGEGTFTAKKE